MADRIPEEVKWIKFYTNIFDDEAIKIILDMPEGSVIFEIWCRLLAAAGKTNDRGLIYFKENIPYTLDTLATVFNKKTKQIQYALKIFEKFNMIKILTSYQILILNWEKYQNVDLMDKIRLQNNERQKRYREKQKALMQKDDVLLISQKNNVTCNVTNNATVTVCNGTEIELEIDKELDSSYISSSSSSKDNFSTTTTPALNDNQKLYGEFSNVCLTAHEYGQLLSITASQKFLDEIIQDLSEAIGRGKYPPYDAKAPNAHFILARAFIKQRRENPQVTVAAPTNQYKSKTQEMREFQNEMDRVIEELKQKELEND